LNCSDAEKWDYLKGLDLFVSCSLWEGFNLPLAEAQALGTAAIAFDTGAHPEVCPLLFSNLQEAAHFVTACASDPELLKKHSLAASHFVRSKFNSDAIVRSFLELYGTSSETSRAIADSPTVPLKLRAKFFWGRFRSLWKSHGPLLLTYKVLRRFYRKLLKA
jgi:hypothetical protein